MPAQPASCSRRCQERRNSKEARSAPVFLSAQQGQAVFLLPVVVLPGLVLVGGVVAVVRRRAAK